ncbi:MAG: hypothetical protein H0W88_07805 [Parachlamydiaceae bacterium]|nr:hypothetical protein [Parachlamydiaceae bacterium]
MSVQNSQVVQVVPTVDQNVGAPSFSKPSDDILAHIFSYTRPKDVENMILTYSTLRVRILNNDKIWQNIAVQMKIPKFLDSLSWRQIVLVDQPWQRNVPKKTQIKLNRLLHERVCHENPQGIYHLVNSAGVVSVDVKKNKVISTVTKTGELGDYSIRYFNGTQGVASSIVTIGLKRGKFNTLKLAIFDKNLNISQRINISQCPSPSFVKIVKNIIFFECNNIYYFYEIPKITTQYIDIKLSDLKAIKGFSYSINESQINIYQENHIQIYSFDRLNADGLRYFQRNLPNNIQFNDILLIQNVLILMTSTQVSGYDFNENNAQPPVLWNFPHSSDGVVLNLRSPIDNSPIFAIKSIVSTLIFNVFSGKNIGKVEEILNNQVLDVLFLKHNSYNFVNYSSEWFNTQEFQPYPYPVLQPVEPLPLEESEPLKEVPQLDEKTIVENEKAQVNKLKASLEKLKAEVDKDKAFILSEKARMEKEKAEIQKAKLQTVYDKSIVGSEKTRLEKEKAEVNKNKASLVKQKAEIEKVKLQTTYDKAFVDSYQKAQMKNFNAKIEISNIQTEMEQLKLEKIKLRAEKEKMKREIRAEKHARIDPLFSEKDLDLETSLTKEQEPELDGNSGTPELSFDLEADNITEDGVEDVVDRDGVNEDNECEILETLNQHDEALNQSKANLTAALGLNSSSYALQNAKLNYRFLQIKKNKESFIYDLAKRTAIYTLLIFSCFMVHRFVSTKLQLTNVQAYIRRFLEKNKVKL